MTCLFLIEAFCSRVLVKKYTPKVDGIEFLDPRGGSLSLTHVVVLHLLLVDFFVSQPTVFIETS